MEQRTKLTFRTFTIVRTIEISTNWDIRTLRTKKTLIDIFSLVKTFSNFRKKLPSKLKYLGPILCNRWNLHLSCNHPCKNIGMFHIDSRKHLLGIHGPLVMDILAVCRSNPRLESGQLFSMRHSSTSTQVPSSTGSKPGPQWQTPSFSSIITREQQK